MSTAQTQSELDAALARRFEELRKNAEYHTECHRAANWSSTDVDEDRCYERYVHGSMGDCHGLGWVPKVDLESLLVAMEKAHYSWWGNGLNGWTGIIYLTQIRLRASLKRIGDRLGACGNPSKSTQKPLGSGDGL